ncbi:MAG: SDR family NAD(P)-dependent oxidoreductase [Flavobacteriales bacterium]
MNKIAIITGATSGFGKAIAEKLASEGFALIITGRRAERLESIAESISSKYGVRVLPLIFDVRNQLEVSEAFLKIPSEWQHWEVLVNNAGLALGRDSIDQGSLADWNQMIDTNVKGLLYVTQAALPVLKKKHGSTIINIGSIAGKECYPGGNVYSATKFAVDALTSSMRIDLNPYGIRVGQIAPGAAETEFSLVRFKGDQAKADAVYSGFVPLSADDIAEAAWFIISRPLHVTIGDILILPTAQANATLIKK